MKTQKKLWYFRIRGEFYAYGPIEASSAAAARRKANQMGFKPVIEVWEVTREAIELIVKEKRRQVDEFRRTGKCVEAFMVADY